MGFPEGTPTVTVQLDKPRELGWTMGAMKRVKELGALGVDWNDTPAVMMAIPSFIWASMDRESREELSPEDVDELVNPTNITDLINQVAALFGASEPDPPEGNEPPAPATKPRAGKKST